MVKWLQNRRKRKAIKDDWKSIRRQAIATGDRRLLVLADKALKGL